MGGLQACLDLNPTKTRTENGAPTLVQSRLLWKTWKTLENLEYERANPDLTSEALSSY